MAIKDMPVSQACFYYVKDNRGVTVNEALEALAKMGFSTRSTSSLICAMVRQGTLGRVEGKLHTRSAEYIPVRKPQKVKDKVTSVKQKAKHVEGIAALGVQATPAPTLETRGTKLTAKQVLETLNVQEAYELYKELDKMFN